MHKSESLYHLYKKADDKVYNKNNEYIGKTTSYKAIAHNGKCIGSIQIINNNNEIEWISGYGVYIVGMGIKVLDTRGGT